VLPADVAYTPEFDLRLPFVAAAFRRIVRLLEHHPEMTRN
jgi:hypothetical protein